MADNGAALSTVPEDRTACTTVEGSRSRCAAWPGSALLSKSVRSVNTQVSYPAQTRETPREPPRARSALSIAGRSDGGFLVYTLRFARMDDDSHMERP